MSAAPFRFSNGAWYDIYTAPGRWVKKPGRYIELEGKDCLTGKEKALLQGIEKLNAMKALLLKGTVNL